MWQDREEQESMTLSRITPERRGRFLLDSERGECRMRRRWQPDMRRARR
jgi:hypothetical protein